jgi:acyl-CoA hydrolase
VKIDPSKVIAVVESDMISASPILRGSDAVSLKIAENVSGFIDSEVKAGRFDHTKQPMQSGTGSIRNGIAECMSKGSLENLTLYTEVLQGPFIDMIRNGQIQAASTVMAYWDDTYENFDYFTKRIILRQQLAAISPEVIRRLGVLSMNTPIEFDIYGHVNSTHIDETFAFSGLGGFGDFARNAYLSIMHI